MVERLQHAAVAAEPDVAPASAPDAAVTSRPWAMGDPGPRGRFGSFGGRFVPEALVPACEQLEAAFRAAWADAGFRAGLAGLRTTLIFNRPGSVKMPGPLDPRFLPTSVASDSNRLLTWALVKPVVSLNAAVISDLLMAFSVLLLVLVVMGFPLLRIRRICLTCTAGAFGGAFDRVIYLLAMHGNFLRSFDP